MLPVIQLLITLASSIFIFVFVFYYLLSLRDREKKVEKKENAIDSDYHHVVDEALSKERKIIDDATSEADQIIKQSQFLSQSSKQEIDNAIKAVVAEIQKEGGVIARNFTNEYSNSLKLLSNETLNEFQTIMTQLQNDLKKQNKEYQNTLLPEIQKEIDEYKKTRMQQIDQITGEIIQKASQEIFNKSISLNDHQKVVIDSLEKAKKEGVFN